MLVHTGQNYDYELNEIFFNDLGIRKPDHFLNVDTSSLGAAVGDIMRKSGEVLAQEKPDALVVLGNGTKEIKSIQETFSSDFGTLRLVHAATVYHQAGARYFVCAGKGEGDVSEAQAMAKLAESLGVPKDKIRIEAKSENTAENALEVKKILGDKKMHIGLVTSAFHMKRSEEEFKKYFDHVTPLPAHYLYASPAKNLVICYMPQAAELTKTSTVVRELIAQLWYRIR